MNKFLTIIIPSYRSKKLVLSHINKLSKNYKIIIIENSYDKKFKKLINEKYKNVEIYLKKNIGYGSAVNFASKKVKTKYFFSINPDSKIYTKTINNLIVAANKIKKFGAISPVSIDKKKYKKKLFIERNKINSSVMLFETAIFKRIKGFDENFFLYYEENDYFTKCNILDLKLYLVTNSYFDHTNSKKKQNPLDLHSTSFTNLKEKNSTYVVGGWHGQWSKFYYLKKYKGYFNAFILCIPNILLNVFQIFPYIFFDHYKAKYKYFKIEGFICSLLGMPSFKRSVFDKKYIYKVN